MLVLKILARRGPMHGYAITTQIETFSSEVLRVEEGSLYPALHRLEESGLVKARWVVTAKKRDGSLDPDALFLMRHSAAHVMAEAIQDVIGKQVLLAYGPPTDMPSTANVATPDVSATATASSATSRCVPGCTGPGTSVAE